MSSKNGMPATRVHDVVKPLVPMALGELFGPVQCERPDCCKAAWMIWMTQDEYDTAKSQEKTHPISHVFVNKIGIALCDECSPKRSADRLAKELLACDDLHLIRIVEILACALRKRIQLARGLEQENTASRRKRDIHVG